MDWDIKHLYLCLLTRGGKVENTRRFKDRFIIVVRMPEVTHQHLYRKSYLISFQLEPMS